MIELRNNTLVFSFPEIHPKAALTLTFQRTLRIPDDESTYSLPPGLGHFPLEHVDDHRTPQKWKRHGGVMLPMYQSEAMWVHFDAEHIPDRGTEYPFAIKIATGKINAVTGNTWENALSNIPQDYMVSTKQPWLDGYCVSKDVIRQFVAMPLGAGYSAEEQITGKAEHGGLQIMVYPMRREIFDTRFPERVHRRSPLQFSIVYSPHVSEGNDNFEMGLAPGGKMHQEIYEDPFDFNDWDQPAGSRCFVHIANSLVWRAITDQEPPTVPFTAKEYTNHGLPWFEYYDDASATIDAGDVLGNLKSVLQKGLEKGDTPLPENETVQPDRVISVQAKTSAR